MGRQAAEDDFITDADDAYEYRDRAHAAEDELSAYRAELRDYVAWLEEPTRGPVIFRSEVVERLSQILAR